MALRPSYAAASNLGGIEFSRGRFAEAARAFERAAALDASDYRVWRNLGISRFYAPGERPQARDALERALRLGEQQLHVNPRDAALLVDLGDCQALLGNGGRARELLKRGLALAPDDVEVQHTAAAAFEQIGDREAALRWIRRALEAGYPRARVEGDPGLAALRADPRYPRAGAQAPGPSSGRRTPAASPGSQQSLQKEAP
jgi:serine/threonine-protein kinase